MTATTGGGSPDPQHLTATTGGGSPDPQHFTATTGGGSPDPQRQTGSRISMKFMRNSRIFFQHPEIFCFFPKGFKEFSKVSKQFSHVNKLFQKTYKNIAFPQQKRVSEKVGPTALKYFFLGNPQQQTATTGEKKGNTDVATNKWGGVPRPPTANSYYWGGVPRPPTANS